MAYNAPMKFNNSTGSDSLASGIGPSTAVTGSGAFCSGGTTAIDLSMDSPDLSGVSVGDCIYIPYLDGALERSLLEITSVNNTSKSITVSSTVTSFVSGQNWAIGGKRAFGNSTAGRAPFNSYNLSAGSRGMQFEIEYTGTTYTQGSGITLTEVCSIYGTGSQLPRIHFTGSGYFLTGSSYGSYDSTLLANLWISPSGVSTQGCFNWTDETLIVDGCKITGETSSTYYSLGFNCNGFDAAIMMSNTEVDATTGVIVNGGDSYGSFSHCDFYCRSKGVEFNSSSSRGSVTNCTFHVDSGNKSGSHGVEATVCQRLHVANCVFNNIQQAISIDDSYNLVGVGNVFVDCSTGYDTTTAPLDNHRLYRSYSHNTSSVHDSAYTDVSIIDANDVALSSNPLTSTDDCTLNATAGADELRDVVNINDTDRTYAKIRPYKFVDDSAGGGGGTTNIFVIED